MAPREVHVVAKASNINAFVEMDRSNLICFRCGQVGHVRSQCLTFKVRPCFLFENGACPDPYCTFAHGAEELRTPWKVRCVRVIKSGDKFMCIGCGSSEHTFRRCPLHSDLIFL